MRKSSAALDSVVVYHRRIADQLDERFSSITGAAPVKANHRPRRTVMEPVSLPTETPDSFDAPDSKTIERAECVDGILKVVFKRKPNERSPRIYTCAGFPQDLWREWTQAPSKGTFFAQRVRPHFTLRAL